MNSNRAESGAESRGGPRRTHRFVVEIPLILWLVVVWAVLWGELTVKNLVVGVIFALLVTRVLALPPVALSHRFNVLQAVVMAVTFLYQVVKASFQVLWVAIRKGPNVRSALVAVKLRTVNDLMIAAVGNTTGVIPGSVLIEVDRSTATLYFHALDVDDDADVEAFRNGVLRTEAAWIRVIGTREELDLLKAEDQRLGRRRPLAVLSSPRRSEVEA
ncbi:Na+/H+ antiporter subunit E [Kocuria sp. JC486]|uniref:Na+/H+ antiporter subunit E n=1 Tax=Kocuria soli TaxID=2485125 RepID=A0A3N3ZWZ8_9MICC|nr:Na+/H+ antiporter subunit E [Kocuria soli]NHU85039.1 Na+/H+ antiporter subunit E [Kocuria sp. JC486]ROZ65632.1 Na+/H+ antiporter subunit E [Kocuria soli]